MDIDAEGLAYGVRYVASPNCDERPEGMEIELLVVHSISLPPGRWFSLLATWFANCKASPAELCG